ncbi:MAG: LysR family transcriptional regulator [Polaromonas sp.]
MAKLDVEWLMVFDGVFKTSSVSRAAEQLGMTQAAASTALNKLRVHFNDPLFSRTARGMLPTPRAEAIWVSVREVLVHLDRARTNGSGFEPAQARRTFRISTTDISKIALLPTLANHLRKVAPHVQIELEKISTDIVRRLQDGEVDLAVGFMPQLEAGFYQQVLFEQNYVCLVAQSHPRLGSSRLTKAAFAREGHVLISASGTGHAMVDKELARAGVDRKVVLRVSSFLGVAQIVAETELIATVPLRYGELMARREKIRLLPVPHALPKFNIKQHWHERFHTDPVNTWLRRTVAELFARGSIQR